MTALPTPAIQGTDAAPVQGVPEEANQGLSYSPIESESATGLAANGELAVELPEVPLSPEEELGESDLVAKLRSRFPSNAYALLTQVPNGTGSHQRRWADAVAFSLWPSRGLDIHGCEVKVSRSDWFAELKDPEKAEEIGKYCDYWWLVVPGKKAAIVHPGELPRMWGLLRWHGGRWMVDKAAPKRAAESPGREFLAAVLRRAQEQMPSDEVLRRERLEGRREGIRDTKEQAQRESVHYQERATELQQAVNAFERESGIDLSSYDADANAAVGRLVQLAQKRGAPYFEKRLRDLAESGVRIVDHIQREIAIVDGRAVSCPCREKNYNHRPDPHCDDCDGTGYKATEVPT